MKQNRVRILKVFIDRCQNSRSTCPPVKEQPQASGATGSDDVSANPLSMNKSNNIGNFRDVLLVNATEKRCCWVVESGTDLRIGKIGHGLGSRAFGAPRNDLFYDDSMLTKNLQNSSEA